MGNVKGPLIPWSADRTTDQPSEIYPTVTTRSPLPRIHEFKMSKFGIGRLYAPA